MKKSTLLTIAFLLFYLILFSQQGNSLNFDGVNDYISIPSTSFCNNSDYTIEGWFNLSSSRQVLVDGIEPGTLNNYIHIEIQTNGTLRYLHRVPSGNSGGVNIYSTSSLADGNWHHFAAVKDTDNKIRLYINGLLEATSTSTVPDIPENIELELGRNSNNAFYLNGNIDDLRFWSDARTLTEIQNNKDIELNGGESNLSIYYTFNQGLANGDNISGCPSGSPCVNQLFDDTGNGNTGSIKNFSLSGSTSNWVNNTPLPVELIYLKGQKLEDIISLKWATASEINNYGFEIQKSNSGENWLIIDFIQGRGTTSEINEYQYQDKNPFLGINYYRLKQIDFEGAFEYSKVIAINFSKERELQLYPNPAKEKFQIVGIEEGEIVIMDYMGKTILQTNFKGLEIDISELANGIYFVEVSSGNQIWTKKLIKE